MEKFEFDAIGVNWTLKLNGAQIVEVDWNRLMPHYAGIVTTFIILYFYSLNVIAFEPRDFHDILFQRKNMLCCCLLLFVSSYFWRHLWFCTVVRVVFLLSGFIDAHYETRPNEQYFTCENFPISMRNLFNKSVHYSMGV